MKRSLAASLSVHGALLMAVLIGLPNPAPFKVEPQEAVQVDISNIGDVTKVMATTKEAVPKPVKPAAQKTEVTKQVKPAPKVAEEEVVAAKQKEPEPEPEPVKKPEPEKKVEDKPVDPDPLKALLEEQKLAEDKKIAEEAALAEKKAAEEEKKKQAEEKKKAEAEKKKKAEDAKKKADAEKKKKQKLDVATLDELLNKENEERTAPKKTGDTDGSPTQGQTEAQGDDAEVAATLIDALRSKLAECWTVPPGAREASITVKVRFNLRKDRTVDGLPIVLSGGGDTLSDATAQSAVSAVMECAPYDFLPAERYDMWQEITVNFTPDMMSGT
ncbi:MAG: cell envelope integrity protein TolA [Phyllobacteriaceae bacterium]|nr:cell envelope integrity protein TolA [Phyllobacteriaceae bacterium]